MFLLLDLFKRHIDIDDVSTATLVNSLRSNAWWVIKFTSSAQFTVSLWTVALDLILIQCESLTLLCVIVDSDHMTVMSPWPWLAHAAKRKHLAQQMSGPCSYTSTSGPIPVVIALKCAADLVQMWRQCYVTLFVLLLLLMFFPSGTIKTFWSDPMYHFIQSGRGTMKIQTIGFSLWTRFAPPRLWDWWVTRSVRWLRPVPQWVRCDGCALNEIRWN